jgi:hypothetical protein
MTLYFIRIFIYTLLPLIAAGLVTTLSREIQSRSQKLEVYLLYLFGLGVAGSGIGGFFGHLFISDRIAESIGWASGSPFQLEMGFANLALGLLGFGAIARKDGFREATVIAVAVIGVGAAIVHFMDIIQRGNLAPGNTIQNVSNLLRPALLIGFLRASRRDHVGDEVSETWRMKHSQAVGWLTGMVATGFGLGFGFGQLVLGTALGVLAGALMVYISLKNLGGEGNALEI